MIGWRVRVGGLIVALGALTASPHEARAQASSADRAAAQALFDQGMKLMDQKKYPDACVKLDQSNRLDPGTGTRFNLADCFSHIGKTATAWTMYLDVAAATKAAGQPDREKVARARAQALEPKLAKLTIVAPSAGKNPGLDVKRDDSTVGSALWGTPLPIDQGEHILVATAPGMESWKGSVMVSGDGASVTATVPELVPPAVATAPPPPVATNPPPATPSALAAGSATNPTPPSLPPDSKDTTTPSGGGTRRIAGLVVAGVGVVGLGVGIGMGASARSKNNDAHDDPTKCPTTSTCYPAGFDEINSAKTAATVSTVAFIAGGVAVAGGLVLYFTAPKGSSASALQLSPILGAGTGGMRIGGHF